MLLTRMPKAPTGVMVLPKMEPVEREVPALLNRMPLPNRFTSVLLETKYVPLVLSANERLIAAALLNPGAICISFFRILQSINALLVNETVSKD